MLQPKIEVKHLSKIFYQHFSDTLRKNDGGKALLSSNDKVVLDDINFVINSGETIGVIGRNGAGKSTLLSILAGVAQQTHGLVTIRGKITAVMTLGVGLREDLTGRENIYLDGELQGKSREETNKFIDQIIAFAELDAFIDRPIKTYSTGMKSRLAFSMLVGLEPEILIIDEALSAGDVFFAEKASNKIKEICKKGKIVLIVSHSMATIESMCNRCIWLENGTLVMDDKPAIVTQSYLKKIREEDQQTNLKSQQSQTSKIRDNANYKIIDVTLKREDCDYQQSVFYTQDSWAVIVEIKRHHAGRGMLNLTIERIDGLIVTHEQYELSKWGSPLPESSFVLQLSLKPLPLNKGYYQLKLELIESNQITNQLNRFLEVRNDHMAKGGASLLDYPAEITLKNKEANLCSDSIALITG